MHCMIDATTTGTTVDKLLNEAHSAARLEAVSFEDKRNLSIIRRWLSSSSDGDLERGGECLSEDSVWMIWMSMVE